MLHAVIYVPGLNDHHSRGQEQAVRLWRIYGVRPSVYRMHWIGRESFESKLAGLLNKIDELSKESCQVSLVGVSAGASAVLNAFAARKDQIHRLICICGKIQHPQTISPRTFEQNPAFKESMLTLPASLAKLGPNELQRIYSLHPLFDGLVPVADTRIKGAYERTLPTIGHAPSILYAITLGAPSLLHLIQKT